MHHSSGVSAVETKTVRRTFIDGPFGQIHCRVAVPQAATRAPLVCLHMSPKSSKSFAAALPFLARDRLVIAPDYPGHGESDPPPAEPEVTIEDFARATWAAVDAITSQPVHMLGYHTGSMVAVAAANQRNSDVVSLTLVSAPIYSESELAELNASFSPFPIDAAGSRFTLQWQRVLQHRGPGMTLPLLAESFAENLRGGENYEWGHRAAFAYAESFAAVLATLDHPIYVMNPADSCFEETRRCDSLLRNGKRVDFPQWGQEFFMAYPEDSAEAVLHYLEQQESR